MPVEKKREKPEELQLIEDLSERGYDDVLILKPETAQKVFTEKRKELLETIQDQSPDSVKQLANRVGRDTGIVSKDLKILVENEIVELKSKNGAKIPEIRHKNVFTQPVILEKE